VQTQPSWDLFDENGVKSLTLAFASVRCHSSPPRGSSWKNA